MSYRRYVLSVVICSRKTLYLTKAPSILTRMTLSLYDLPMVSVVLHLFHIEIS
jgi:hypothetical protein